MPGSGTAIDSDRIFVAGQLMGGNMAWDLALSHPDLFAGVVVISGLPAKYVPRYLPHHERLPLFYAIGELAPAANEFIYSKYIKPLILKTWDITYVEYFRRGLEALPEEITPAFDWMDRRRRDPFPKSFKVNTARISDDRFYGVVVREFEAGRTTAPEAVEVLGKNLESRHDRDEVERDLQPHPAGRQGRQLARHLAQPQAHRLQAERPRSGSTASPTAARPRSNWKWSRCSTTCAFAATGSSFTGIGSAPDEAEDGVAGGRTADARMGSRRDLLPDFPDRFARADGPQTQASRRLGRAPTYHGYQGGDLIGVVEHLDYLVALGVTAIYFTPIFQSASNHRYHTHDYEKVDPMLGGTPALRRMIDEAHARGIRVVLDGVFNHASRGSSRSTTSSKTARTRPISTGSPSRSSRLTPTTRTSRPTIKPGGACPHCPNSTQTARRFASSSGGSAASGSSSASTAGGSTCPTRSTTTASGASFATAFAPAIPKRTSSARSGPTPQRWLKGDMWDAVMNYQFTRACIAFFIGETVDEADLRKTSLFPVGPADGRGVSPEHRATAGLVSPERHAVMLNLLGSHDMARFVSLARGDVSALRLATLFQMTYPGAPSIYYGDEIGMTGGHDPANRGPFPGIRPTRGIPSSCTNFSD